ncbi:MAG: hypothetical protein ABR964_01330 [Tepidisphaeraceae bacterium]|jgi:hypothetical protein
MLRVWLILTAAAACGLIAASCAEIGTAIATAKAAQAATIASTEAIEATTQVAGALQGQAAVTTLPSAPGTTVIETPDYYIILKDGQRIIVLKSALRNYSGLDNNK